MVRKEQVKKIIAKTYLYGVLLLMYLPILVLVVYSFTESDQLGVWNGFSFQLYVDLFKNDPLMSATKNTLIIAIVSAVVSTILGTLGAIGVFYSKKRYQKTVETATQLPVVNAEIVMALSLAVLFKTLQTSYSFGTLLIGHLVLTVAFVYLNVKPKLAQMDPNIYEAALDLGASPKRALWKVVLPEIMPGIFSGFMLTITLSLDDYIITAFTRNNSFSTLSTYIYGATAKKGALPPVLRALTTVITLAVLLILLVINYKSKNKKTINRRGMR